MKYFNEKGIEIPASEADLNKGWLEDRTYIHHAAVTHEERYVQSGIIIVRTVTDKPAWYEVTEQTYYRYADHISWQEPIEAQLMFTATMTDTLLEG